MYILEDFLDDAKGEEKWTSDAHRQVAAAVCLCNPNIFTWGTLTHNVEIINAIPKDKIKKVTAQDLEDLGCTV
jgi:hypothetical protein